MIPRPPGSFSRRRIGHGLRMSKTRKEMKAAAIQEISLGNNRHVAHMPTNSSHTARWGSGSDGSAKLPVAHTPTRKPTPMAKYKPTESSEIGVRKYATKATRLPAVAGATGAKPVPKPVPTSQANRLGRSDMNRLNRVAVPGTAGAILQASHRSQRRPCIERL